EFGLAAYPSVVRAIKTAPKEALPHLTLVRDKLKGLIDEDDDPPLDQDVIVTADGSRLAGTLTPETVRLNLGGEEKAGGGQEGRGGGGGGGEWWGGGGGGWGTGVGGGNRG